MSAWHKAAADPPFSVNSWINDGRSKNSNCAQRLSPGPPPQPRGNLPIRLRHHQARKPRVADVPEWNVLVSPCGGWWGVSQSWELAQSQGLCWGQRLYPKARAQSAWALRTLEAYGAGNTRPSCRRQEFPGRVGDAARFDNRLMRPTFAPREIHRRAPGDCGATEGEAERGPSASTLWAQCGGLCSAHPRARLGSQSPRPEPLRAQGTSSLSEVGEVQVGQETRGWGDLWEGQPGKWGSPMAERAACRRSRPQAHHRQPGTQEGALG